MNWENEPELCRMCNQPRSPNHDADAPGMTSRHPFVKQGEDIPAGTFKSKQDKEKERNVSQTRSVLQGTGIGGMKDPGLRVALINKGILTEEDIRKADELILLVMGGQAPGGISFRTRGTEKDS